MSNQKKAILIIVLAVLVVAVVSILVLRKSSPSTSPLAADNKAAVNDADLPAPPIEEAIVNNANPNLYSFAGDQKAEAVEVEFMSDTEKASLGIPVAARIQVLDRDENGKCIAWKLINQDSEILHEYVK